MFGCRRRSNFVEWNWLLPAYFRANEIEVWWASFSFFSDLRLRRNDHGFGGDDFVRRQYQRRSGGIPISRKVSSCLAVLIDRGCWHCCVSLSSCSLCRAWLACGMHVITRMNPELCRWHFRSTWWPDQERSDLTENNCQFAWWFLYFSLLAPNYDGSLRSWWDWQGRFAFVRHKDHKLNGSKYHLIHIVHKFNGALGFC